MANYKIPRIGVGVIIFKGNKVILGKIKKERGKNTWGFPGGHLEYGETIFECAKREVGEEAGIKIKNIRFASFTNDFFTKEKLHYVTVYVTADYASGEPKTREPNKVGEWQWFEWKKLPRPLFLPVQNLLKKHYNPFSV